MMSALAGKSSVVWLLLAASLAGCVAEEADGEAAADDGGDGADDAGTGGTGPAADANLPPVAEITVSVLDEGNHTYAFDAGNSSDPEGGNLTYLWDFGDDATSMNASVEHTFDATGLSGNVSFNVTLTVTDEQGLTGTDLELVEFTAGPPKGVLYETTVLDDSGTLVVGTAGGSDTCAQSGVDCEDFILTIGGAATDGTAVEARTVRIVLTTTSASGVDQDLFLLDPSEAEIDASTSPTGNEAIDYSVGKKDAGLAPGDYIIRVVFWAGVVAQYTVHAEVDYYTV